MTKTCSKCSTSKPLGEFYAHPTGLHGCQERCKECVKACRRRTAEQQRRAAGIPVRAQVGRSHKKANGYVLVFVGRAHPMSNKQGYCLEHRLVMAKAVGRLLTPLEVVHHINSLRDDNRIENLMLFADQQAHRQHHVKVGQ